MECLKIQMFDRFDKIAAIMPYFAHTDKAFLLLSQLCSTTRQKLDEFYNEFICCMKKQCIQIKINFSGLDCLLVPNDLFEVKFEAINSSNIKKFIRFVKNINQSKGWYFNKH